MAVTISLLLCPLFLPFTTGFLQPLTKSNGDPDMTSIVSHVTNMEQTIANLQAEAKITNADLATVKVKLQSAEDELAAVRSELSSTKKTNAMVAAQVQDLSANLTDCNSSNSTQLSQISDDLSGIQNELTGIKRKVDFKEVSFRFFWNTPNDIFKQNVGGGFDYTFKRFIAPVSGTYMFWITSQFSNLDYSESVRILKGNELLATGFALAHDNASLATAFAVEHLDVGDRVFFTPSSTDKYLQHGHSNTYGGVLLHPE